MTALLPQWLVFVVGFLSGFSVATTVAAFVVAYRLLRTPERLARIDQTGLATPVAARVRPARPEPEERVRQALREDAISVGAQSLIEAAEANGRTLKYEEARARAAQLIDQTYEGIE